MALGKRLARSRLGLAALTRLYARYTGLVFATSRWQTLGREEVNAMVRAGRPFIAAFWHNRLMMAPQGWREEATMNVVISRHRDGEAIARAVRHLGIAAIRGSRTRGGAAALRTSVRLLRDGGYVGITPDGPRGPRMRVQPGIIAVARLSGAPIVPVTYAVSRRVVAESWDRFVIALPFSRGVYVWGEPIHVDAKADEAAMEAARLLLEERLIALAMDADRMVDVAPIEPAARVAPAVGTQDGAQVAGSHP